jgi:hypothetical protein
VGDFVLENDALRAGFSRQSGALVSLTSKLTSWQIQKPVEDALAFRMYVPMEGRRSNIIYGIGQKPVSMECAERPANQGPLVITWSGLESNNAGILDITFRATVSLTEFGLTFEGEVENNSHLTIESVSFPCLTSISPPAPDDGLVRMNQMTKSFPGTPLYPRFRDSRGYWGVDHPSTGLLFERTPYLLVTNGTEGLYMGAHRRGDQPGVDHTFEQKPGHRDFFSKGVPRGEEISGHPVRLENRNVHFPFIEPGQRKTLTPVVLQPYVGTWHAGVDVYKKWRSSWFTRAKVPTWADDIHSWQQIHINSSEGELRCRYSDLVKHARQCVKHGVKAIQLTGWTMWGQDGYLPDHNIDPRLGTWEDLKKAVAEIQAMGVKVVLYVKYQFADLTTDWYKKELHRLACHDFWGNRCEFEGYSYQSPGQMIYGTTHRLAMMCMSSAEWRKLMHEQFRKCIEVEADGALNDEIQNFRSWHFCFDKDHGHGYPAYIDSGACVLADELAEIAAAEHRGSEPFLLAGENHSDLLKLTHGLSYFRVFEGHIPAERYIDSRFPFMVSVVGFDDRESINACLLYRYIMSYEPFHFRGELDDFPLTMEYGKKVDDLRRRYREFLWDGEFRDVLGAMVDVDGGKVDSGACLYSVFRSRSSGKHAVVAANYSEAPIEARVVLGARDQPGINGGAQENARQGAPPTLAVVSPEEPDPRPCNGTVAIPGRSAVVVMET